MTEQTPMIWTTRGNLPLAELTYTTRWEHTDDYLKLVETYRLGDEIVRESAHVYALRGLLSEAQTPTLN